jgi:enoyl-CoA hydratase/carnithine racemase
MSRIQPPPGGDTTGEMPLDAAPVVVESSDGVAVITLNRPAKRNAVTLAMWGALAERVGELAADPEVRVLVIRGAGDHFCAGADISELTNGPGGEYARINWAAEEAIAAFPGPTIAEIRGNCIGGGVSIATACDLRFAAEGSTFGITPAKLGIVYPTNALERTVRLIGGSAAKHLMFSGDLIDHARALRIGHVARALAPHPGGHEGNGARGDHRRQGETGDHNEVGVRDGPERRGARGRGRVPRQAGRPLAVAPRIGQYARLP